MENENCKMPSDLEQPMAEEITLEKLLAQVTDDNQHPEIDFGPARGNEAW